MDSILDELIHLVAVKGGSTGSTLHETLSFLPYSDLKYWEYAFHFIRNISSFEITNLPATQIPFDDLVSQLGHSIRVIASLETRRKFLLGAQESTPNGILSDINFSILALVAKYTSIGATMIDIAKELNIDPRSLFAYVKALVERGFVYS